uniref:Fe-S oxidoreductase n=1 Tax=Solanum tuberosum TaxID=4113 RepID=M1A7Y7_SOLTU
MLIRISFYPTPFTTPAVTGSASTPTPPAITVAPRSPSTTTHSTTTPPTTTAAPRSPSTTTPVTAKNPSTEDDDDLVSGPVESDFLEEEGSDYSTEDSVESECGLVGDNDEDYGSDVHEEKAQIEGEHSTKGSRGRPPTAPSASPGPAKRSRGRPPAAPAKSARGRPPATPSTSATPTKGARGRPLIAPATPSASAAPAKSARGRPPAAPSAPPTCSLPANYHVGSSTPADYQSTNSNRGRGRGRGSTTSYKRQAVIGMGVFQAENRFKALNIFSTGTTKVTKSADFTGDIGYKPSTATKLKWNGKQQSQQENFKK